MKKQFVVLGVLLILAGAFISALYFYHDDIRSETEILYGSAQDSDYDAMVRIGDTNYWNVSVNSNLHVYGKSHGTNCIIFTDIIVNESNVFEEFSLYNSYVADGNSLIPSDAAPDQDFGPSISRQYTDPITGDTLLFRESNGILESIRFTGTTVVGDEGKFMYVGFDLIIEYKLDATYVNSIETVDPGTSTTDAIIGSEDGVGMSGDVIVDPVFRMVSPREDTLVVLNVSIPDTGLPSELLTFWTFTNGEGVCSVGFYTPYLRQDSAYVIPHLEYKFGVGESGEMVFTMVGNITVYQLDGDCNILSQDAIEFSYGVV